MYCRERESKREGGGRDRGGGGRKESEKEKVEKGIERDREGGREGGSRILFCASGPSGSGLGSVSRTGFDVVGPTAAAPSIQNHHRKRNK